MLYNVAPGGTVVLEASANISCKADVREGLILCVVSVTPEHLGGSTPVSCVLCTPSIHPHSPAKGTGQCDTL